MLSSSRCTFFIAISLLLLSSCSDRNSSRQQHGDAAPAEADTTRTTAFTGPTEAYTQSRYDISLQVPEGWILTEEPNLKVGTFAINLFRKGTRAGNDLPLGVHVKARHSYVAIWPHGIGTELPYSQYASLDTLDQAPNLRFPVDYDKSKALLLKDGSVWAYYIRPEDPPEEWEKYGFIFAQVRTTNNQATCYDEKTHQEIPLDTCDFLQGDRYVRQADLDREDSRTIRAILEHLSLEPVAEKPPVSDLIQVTSPLPNMDVSEPLTATGKARGSWYFEGSFKVELLDADGNVLAEGQAQAQGDWMTEDFVPFSVTLSYDAPDDERGQLIFHRANPSGKAENANSYQIPVLFPPK